MIEEFARYKAPVGKVKIALLSELVAQGVPPVTAIECANDCVQAGSTTNYWRSKLSDEVADLINTDLARLKA